MTSKCKGVGKGREGVGWGGLAPPDFKHMLLCVKAVTTKGCPNENKRREKKKL